MKPPSGGEKTNPIQTQSKPALSAVEWANCRKSIIDAKCLFTSGYEEKMRLRAMKKQSQNKPNFRNGQNECNLKYNKGLLHFSALRPPKKQTQTNPILLI